MKAITSLALIFSLILCSRSLAQNGNRPMNYDPKTVETISGDIVSIDSIKTDRRATGIHLTLKTAKETIPIHLGPDWYLSRQQLQLHVKDQIEVTGSRITYDGKPAVIAAKIKKGNDVLVLRNASGIPNWSRRQ